MKLQASHVLKSAFSLSSSFDVQGVYKEVDFARRGFVYNGGYPV